MKSESTFVKIMNRIDRMLTYKSLWKSDKKRTYVKSIHGDLIKGLSDEGKKIQKG